MFSRLGKIEKKVQGEGKEEAFLTWAPRRETPG
jgi:hypothetical protein